LGYALQEVINRHEVLRTVILAEEGLPYQRLLAKDGWQLGIEVSGQYKDPKVLQDRVEELIGAPFDLSAEHPLRGAADPDRGRGACAGVDVASYCVGWVVVVDPGTELVELYGAYVEGRAVRLSPPGVQYADYAIRQRSYLEGAVLEEKLRYWREQLVGAEPLELPTDFVRPAVQSTRGAGFSFTIDKH